MRSNKSSVRQSNTFMHALLAITAIVAVVTLSASAEGGWFGAKGPGGGAVFSNRASAVRIGNPSNKTGNWGAATNGGNRLVGKPGGNGGNKLSDGGNRGGNDDGPRRPRLPKVPIIVAVPPAVTTVTTTTPALGVVQTNPGQGNGGGNGGGSASTTGQSTPRRITGGVPPTGEQHYVPDEVLIQLASTVTPQGIDAFSRRMGLTRVESYSANGVTTFRWKIPDPTRRPVPTVVRALEAQSIVIAAQPNYIYRVQEQPTQASAPSEAPAAGEGDPGQYALAKLHLPQAHALAKGEKVLVAVIDSAVDVSHPELEGMVAESYDALGSEEKPDAQHGTAIAGAIVAHARLMGVAPKASILAIRAFGTRNNSVEATSYSINKGVDWALSHGARVINMSFTGPRDPAIERKLTQARAAGVVLIAAAGNAGPKSEPLYPAAYPNVIAVTATDPDDKLYVGANRGKHIAFAAPGVDILLPAPDAQYQLKTGTSFACAEVSGIVALLLERKSDLGHDGVRKVLTATAHRLGPKGSERDFGAGLVDAYEAIRSIEPPITTGARVIPAAGEQ
jgi:hypothetical protein